MFTMTTKTSEGLHFISQRTKNNFKQENTIESLFNHLKLIQQL